MATSCENVSVSCHCTAIGVDEASVSMASHEVVLELVLDQRKTSVSRPRLKLDQRSLVHLCADEGRHTVYADEEVLLERRIGERCEVVATFSTDPFRPLVLFVKVWVRERSSPDRRVLKCVVVQLVVLGEVYEAAVPFWDLDSDQRRFLIPVVAVGHGDIVGGHVLPDLDPVR